MKDNPKVYVVFYQFYDDAHVERVFIEKEAAMNYVAEKEKDDYEIGSFIVCEIQTE